MRTRSIATLAGLGLIILAAASCNKEQGSYRGIRFQAKSYGYLGVPGAADTKTTYTGQMTGTTERIEWTNGDLIRIVSDKAYMLDDENVHQCDFCVDGHTEEGAVSSASIDPVDAANALQWQTGKHHFWAMYPSPATAGVPAGTALSSTGTMTFAIPATQVVTKKDGEMTWLPNMKQAPMLAHKVTTPSASVPLEFTPQFTAFEFTVSKGSLPGVTLTGFRLIRMDDTGFTGTLAGTYTIAFDGENGVYESTPTVTSGARTEIAIDWSATDNRIVLDADHPDFTFTVFALPETLKGLKIEFTGRFSNIGEDFTQTRSLRLRSAAGEALNFLPFLKYKIYGLSFPEMVDATIEDSINWDHSVLVMDNVVWWMNAGLDYTNWVVEDTGSRYAYLQDKLAWWIPSGVADDITWEEIKDIQLDDASDAYLWRHQSVTRTAYLRNYSNQTYSDVTVAWSAEQEGNAVHVNEHTGEVTALRPGEATVTATVTPNDGSTPWNVSYKVYVNAPTGITLTADSDFVRPDDTVELTAAVTCTSYGTPTAYPADLLEWSSVTPAKITVSGSAQPAIATGQATATATGLAEGTSTLSVSVATKYADGITASLTDFLCEDRTTITFPDWNEDGEPDGEKYKFRGYYLSPGVLKYDGNSETGSHGYTLTNGSDPLELLQHYYYDGKTNGYDGTAATHTDLNVYYHAWHGTNSLYHRLHNVSTTSTNADITATITVSGQTWKIPTGNTDGDWDKIFTTSLSSISSPNITINGTPKSDASYNYVRITVDLTNATKANGAAENYNSKGLGTGSYIGNTAGNSQYQCGILLIPDGAKVSCNKISSIPGSFSSETNCLGWDDLKTLTDGGCVFLPAAGSYNGSSWLNGGLSGLYWSATQNDASYAYYLLFYSSNVNATNTYHKYMYMPVRLVRE